MKIGMMVKNQIGCTRFSQWKNECIPLSVCGPASVPVAKHFKGFFPGWLRACTDWYTVRGWRKARITADTVVRRRVSPLRKNSLLKVTHTEPEKRIPGSPSPSTSAVPKSYLFY